MSKKPIVARLNAVTFPMLDAEREILAFLNADVVELEGATDDEILSAAKNADAVMIVSAYLHGNVIRELQHLRVISRLGTGTDKIDVDEATRCGIVVANLPDFSTEEVADHTLALILASARRLKYFEACMRAGEKPSSVAGMHRLAVQTLGIIGFGRIGKAVAKRAMAFGMRILAYDPLLTPGEKNEWNVEAVDFETVLSQSDYLSLLCPLTSGNREMIRMEQLRMMKPASVLINTGRGELVHEEDLVEALKTGVIQGAAIDVFAGINVFSESGFSTNHPYFTIDNILLTPHVSANSEEAMIASRTGGSRAVVDVLSGFYPRHVVNCNVIPRIPLQDARNEKNL
ncbi:MAG: C-terminal binding protein [Planctomycetaceae bacterium]|nr:C-terminal binding protein [Planctomycetaceae bacterium]